MNEGEALDIAQEYVRSAPLKTAANFVWWAQGVIDMREAAEAQPKRKKRSDAGKSRNESQELIDLKEITK
jgi:hypothetical protein